MESALALAMLKVCAILLFAPLAGATAALYAIYRAHR